MIRHRVISDEWVRPLLLSGGRPRVWRHGLFWVLFALYFYMQGISPDCVKGLERGDVFYYAFTSVVCFLPACAVSVYAFLYVLAPQLLKRKSYWGFAGDTLVLFAGLVGLNYLFCLLFFVLSYHGPVTDIPAIRVFSMAFLNSQNAVLGGLFALGMKMGVGWYYQKKENLRLARVRAKSRIETLKAKARPDYLLGQLAKIAAHIRAGAGDPPEMVLNLANLLRHWLYDGTNPAEEESSGRSVPAASPASGRLHAFVFAEKGPARYYRHLVFWGARYVFNLVANIIGVFLLLDHYSPNLTMLLPSATSLGLEIVYTYALAYGLLPWFLARKKYFILLCLGAVFTLAILATNVWTDHLWDSSDKSPDLSLLGLWGTFWAYTGYGPPEIAAIFIILKTVKAYARTQREKEALIAENSQAEALLLKAQVHPHFLFNTLNNIYSFSRRQPGIALDLIENLSSTVRYMTKECSAEYVPLGKELDLIRDYIELERVRYGERLKVTLRVEGEADDKYIDPLLLIPLVENCFKHGASQLLEDAWIKVFIFIDELELCAEMSNNRPVAPGQPGKKGIGLANVRKRLRLLHPGNHVLEIRPGEDQFFVRIQLPLRANFHSLSNTHAPEVNLSDRR